jgi:hypothetical protein
MKVHKIHRDAVRSTHNVQRVTTLADEELLKIGGGATQETIGFCFPCPGSGCLVYVDFNCIAS